MRFTTPRIKKITIFYVQIINDFGLKMPEGLSDNSYYNLSKTFYLKNLVLSGSGVVKKHYPTPKEEAAAYLEEYIIKQQIKKISEQPAEFKLPDLDDLDEDDLV